MEENNEVYLEANGLHKCVKVHLKDKNEATDTLSVRAIILIEKLLLQLKEKDVK